MEIGKPKRVYRVEPVREPVPPRRREAQDPAPAREAPKPVPTR